MLHYVRVSCDTEQAVSVHGLRVYVNSPIPLPLLVNTTRKLAGQVRMVLS
jgi:hypothetical protein